MELPRGEYSMTEQHKGRLGGGGGGGGGDR